MSLDQTYVILRVIVDEFYSLLKRPGDGYLACLLRA